ncbi:MAG: hypothetical protein HYY23_00050 [Verrucomicrobia bacterium]|nr:hypothetical protein [Verrucomicrobiota bacterium]
MTERWTPSAKSVFQFDVQGQVATSTHAGLPWLRFIRHRCRGRVHFWPFDGWEIPAGRSVSCGRKNSVGKPRMRANGRESEHESRGSPEMSRTIRLDPT